MWDPTTNSPHTAHTLNLVEVFAIGEGLVAGKPNKIIAFDYEISPRTVEIYRANVMTKMQAASLSELVRMAIIAGVFDDGAKPRTL